jgi:hypothetical protein
MWVVFMINKIAFNLLAALAINFPLSVMAEEGPPPLLKRTDIKSYEGFIQVTPNESPKINLVVNFIKPTYDYTPVSSGAMVGLIQRSGSFSGMKLNFDEQCSGAVKLKIGIKEFNGTQYGYINTTWQFSAYTSKVSLITGQFKGKDNESIDTVDSSYIQSFAVKGKDILIDFPTELPYLPGDVLVLEDIIYTTNEDRVFKQCSVRIKEK